MNDLTVAHRGQWLPTEPQQSQVPANAGAGELTKATEDRAVAEEWLLLYKDSNNRTRTWESYRRESERLILWMESVGARFQTLTVLQVKQFHEHLLNPQPVEHWCSNPIPRYLEDGSKNPAWRPTRPPRRQNPDGSENQAYRPFVSALSESAASQAMTILSGLFSFFVDVGYVKKNPWEVAESRVRTEKEDDDYIDRYLEPRTVKAVEVYLESMPRESKQQIARYYRDKFVFEFLFHTGLRRDEYARVMTADIKLWKGRPWLHLVGKGRKAARIPLNTKAMAALNAYRENLGRAPLPAPKDAPSEPLLFDAYGHGKKNLTGAAIYAIIKDLFARAAAGTEDPEIRAELEAGSTHWMRHTACSSLVNEAGVSVNIASKLLRHKSVATTSRYLHAERDRLADEIEKLSM